MDNFTLFDDHNNALLLFYDINSAVCIFLNLLAIYLIVFKSTKEMGEYRWYLLHYQVAIPSVFIVFPAIIIYIRILEGRLGLQILNDLLMVMLSGYGPVATTFLIFFNVPYRKFLFGKLKEFGILRNRAHPTKVSVTTKSI
uniref:G_PROTEIN_RECEP_F1_2 domain-containing protein n=1 Tax=Heterorhabditis bacteriophora TaxID=37862 RepID=A0A1I7WS64_HETBA